jgi:hypothetical protein
MRKLLFIGILLSQSAWAAHPTDLDFVQARSLPMSLTEFLLSAERLEPYALDSWINPFYLQGDFNGDGSRDTAVLIREKRTEKGGILIVHGAEDRSFVVGAGSPIGNGGDDFSWMDAWFVYVRGVVGQSAHAEEAPPTMRGDALMVIKTEAASGIIYWTGAEYAWYQQAD